MHGKSSAVGHSYMIKSNIKGYGGYVWKYTTEMKWKLPWQQIENWAFLHVIGYRQQFDCGLHTCQS